MHWTQNLAQAEHVSTCMYIHRLEIHKDMAIPIICPSCREFKVMQDCFRSSRQYLHERENYFSFCFDLQVVGSRS